jgi:hypothetical protein
MATYTSFGGTDITAVFNGNVFGELQMVSYRVNREKAPVYTMGSVDPRSIARGKRMVSGVCVFIIFDKESLLDAMKEESVWLGKDELATYGNGSPDQINKAAIKQGGSVRSISDPNNPTPYTGAQSVKQKSSPVLADQVLPFDITLVGVSEYGKAITMSITGVELMSESGGVSIDDISLEKQMAFIARRVGAWKDISYQLGAA